MTCSLVGFCCAAALSIGAWVCSSECAFHACVCVCPFFHCCLRSRSRASKRKHTTSSGSQICFVCECKSQCLCSVSPSERALYSICVCIFHARLRACTPVRGRVWVVVRDCHGSVIPLITTAAWRNRLLFSAAVTEKRSQVDKPHQQI